MTLSAQRRLLYLGSALCFIGAVLVLFTSLAPRSIGNAEVSLERKTAKHVRSTDLGVNRDKLRALCQIDLLRPLHDAPSVEIPKTIPSSVAPSFSGQLVATMVESRSRLALIQVGKQCRLLGVGDVVEGATVVEVQTGTVKLQVGTQHITLSVKQSSPATKRVP